MPFLSLLLVVSAPTAKLGIFALKVAGIDAAFQQSAIDALATTAQRFPGYKVITKTEIEAMLGAEKIKDSLGCNDVACLAEIGSAVGVDHVLSGSIARIDQSLVVSLQLVNTGHASVENRVTLNWEGEIAKLTEVLSAAAELVVLTGKERKPARLNVRGAPPDAVVIIDGMPGALQQNNIEVGVHKLRIEAGGHKPYVGYFVARSGAVSQLDVQLAETDPFYKKWWFWTPIGAVVAGGIAAGVAVGVAGANGKKTGVDITFPNTLPGAR